MKAKQYFVEIFKKNEKQDHVIDAIRAISVLSIIAFHVVVGIIAVYEHEKAKQYILNMPSILQPLWHGEKGVDAFFLLSALVIGIPIFKNLEAFDVKASIFFLVKKLKRIYPLFFVALCLYTVAQWGYFGKYFFSNALFLNNIIPGERTIIPVGWFLTVEVQYFILTPLLFLGLKKTKFCGIILGGLFLSSILACAAVLSKHSDLYMRPITDLFLAADRNYFSDLMGRKYYEANLTRFGPFVLGFLLAYIKVFYSHQLLSFLNSSLKSLSVFFTSMVCLVLPITVPIYHPSSWYYNDFSTNLNFWTLATSRQVFSIGVFFLVIGCWYCKGTFTIINRVFKLDLWRPLSKLSYPMYLFHFPLIGVAAAIVFGTVDVKQISDVSFIQGCLIFVLAAALTFLFSLPFHLFIERPFMERAKNQSN